MQPNAAPPLPGICPTPLRIGSSYCEFMMQCKTCQGEMIQKSRLRLFVAGSLMVATLALAFFIPYFWLPGIILSLIGIYLIAWATLGKGYWCRTCKKFTNIK